MWMRGACSTVCTSLCASCSHATCAYASRARAASRWQVWQSLPSSLQQAFASQKIALVELALKLLLDEVGEQELESLMQRCLEARFWDTPEDHSV